MKLIAGLGNPGKQYEHTRHNAGFLAIDHFLKTHDAITCASKFNAQICEYHENGEKIFLVKPQSFMNLSGEVVSELVNFYKLDASKDILIIHDEVDLPLGTVREARDSSHAGHNGIRNIIDELGSKDFARVRIGVETRESRDDLPTDAFVLQKFTDEELSSLDKMVLPGVNDIIEKFIKS
ncbi:MAG TPA: aminoacyl-tRNA hydrolase [Patescibacteria group bacterium]|jgi:PTH1 family peptidyl-tRNA hydrolase|nr:aminoacyl-tRNA hydrolase [Patescibacteria group bacterium]